MKRSSHFAMPSMTWLAVVVTALALGGCGRHASASSTRSAEEAQGRAVPVEGGKLTFAFDGASITEFTLDPHKSGFAPHHRIMRSLFDSLVVLLPGHRIAPWLATSWEVSPAGTEYTFHLRNDVKFHDGTRFDAEAVKFNLDRLVDPANAFFGASDIGPYRGSVVVDDFTVRVELREPYAPLLAHLSKSSLGMVSPAAARKLGTAFPSQPVGSGPFRLKSLVPGSSVILERNPDYRWPPAEAGHDGPARLAELEFRDVPDESTRMAVLENGQADAVDLVPAQNLAALRASPQFHVISGELLNHNYSLYPNVARAPWSDVRMRRALRQSLDLDAAVKTVYFGTQARAWCPLSPSIPGYDPSLEGVRTFDPAEAARTLDDLGWRKGPDGVRHKDGQRLTIQFLDTQGNREKRLDVLTILRQQLHNAGFELRIESVPSSTYLAKSSAGDFDLVGGSLFAPDADVLRRIYSPAFRAATSVTKVNDPELERLLVDGYREMDPARRSGLYAEAQRRIFDQVYEMPVYVLLYTVACSTRAQDVRIDAHGLPSLYDAWVRP